MIDHSDVMTTVRSKLKLLDFDERLIVWENESRDPPATNVIYIEEYFNPFDEGAIGSGVDRLMADHRFDVVGPKGHGITEMRKLASRIKSLYPNGSSIVGKITVVVDKAQILPGVEKDDVRYKIPVAISIRVEANRNEGV